MDEALIRRNSVEVVTDPELSELVATGSATAYCGYETSGPVHIGHMVTVTKLLDLLEAGVGVKVLFADVHTRLNRKGGGEWVDSMVEYWKACFRAMGLEKAEFVKGSSFQFEQEYMEDVLSLALSTTMNRALRSMQEVARDIDNAHVSQVIYPLMQIVDIKALGADIAYGGLEQRKIHMLAREALPELGYKKPICLHTPLLCSLQGPESKMSSSDPRTIIAIDEEEAGIMKKVNSAYCPKESEGNPVIDIARLLIFPRTGKMEVRRPEKFGGDVSYDSFEALESAYAAGQLHPADLKKSVGAHLAKILAPVREKLLASGVNIPKE